MQDKELKRAFRNAWFLALLGAVYIVLFFAMATATSPPGEDEVDWNMGGTDFVPASSVEAEGYYLPVTEPDWQGFGKDGSE